MSVRVISGRKAGGGQERVEQGRVGHGQEEQLQRATPNAAIAPKHVMGSISKLQFPVG